MILAVPTPNGQVQRAGTASISPCGRKERAALVRVFESSSHGCEDALRLPLPTGEARTEYEMNSKYGLLDLNGYKKTTPLGTK